MGEKRMEHSDIKKAVQAGIVYYYNFSIYALLLLLAIIRYEKVFVKRLHLHTTMIFANYL